MANLRRRAILAAFFTLAGGTASAHVTISPKEAGAGTYAKLTIRVAHGCGGSSTTIVRVAIPEGVGSVKPQVNRGWTIAIKKEPLVKPVADGHGGQITEVVREVSWSGGPLPDEHMDEFGLSVKLPETEGKTLLFPVVQTCEKGENKWVDAPTEGKHGGMPSPSVRLTAKVK